MTGVLALAGHSLRRRRSFLAAAFSVLFLFEILMTAVARSLEQAGIFSKITNLMPEFMREWTNMAAGSFRGMVMFGHSHPIVVLFLAGLAISIATEPAEEIESKFVDLVMARPLPRATTINRSIVVLLLVIFGAAASMVLGTTVGVWLLKPASADAPGTQLVLSMAANLALTVLAWGGIALAIASTSNRRATASAKAGLLVFAMYVLDYVGRFWDAAAPVARISPFHYYNPFQLLGGQPLRAADVAVLTGIAVAGFALAHMLYAKRDL